MSKMTPEEKKAYLQEKANKDKPASFLGFFEDMGKGIVSAWEFVGKGVVDGVGKAASAAGGAMGIENEELTEEQKEILKKQAADDEEHMKTLSAEDKAKYQEEIKVRNAKQKEERKNAKNTAAEESKRLE